MPRVQNFVPSQDVCDFYLLEPLNPAQHPPHGDCDSKHAWRNSKQRDSQTVPIVGVFKHKLIKLGTVACTCKFNYLGGKAGGWQVQAQPELQNEFSVTLDYT